MFSSCHPAFKAIYKGSKQMRRSLFCPFFLHSLNVLLIHFFLTSFVHVLAWTLFEKAYGRKGQFLSRCNSAPGEGDVASRGRAAAAGCSGGAEHRGGLPAPGLLFPGPGEVRSPGVLSSLSTQPGWTSPASALRDRPPASPAVRSSASPRKVLGIAHRGAPPAPSVAGLPQPATKPANRSTALSTE